QSDELVFHQIPSLISFQQPATNQQDLIVENKHHVTMEGNTNKSVSKTRKRQEDQSPSSSKPNSATLEDSTKDEHTQRKLVHREIERQRRQDMAKLYASLRGLLPLEFVKGKRSTSDHMHQAVNYIKHMQENIKEMAFKRDQLKKFVETNLKKFVETNVSGPGTNSIEKNLTNLLPNTVSLHSSNGGIQISINSCPLEEGFPLSRILKALSKEGFKVITCTCTKVNDRLIHSIQAEENDPVLTDLSMLQQRLTVDMLARRKTTTTLAMRVNALAVDILRIKRIEHGSGRIEDVKVDFSKTTTTLAMRVNALAVDILRIKRSSGGDDEGFIEVKKKKSGGNGGTKKFKPVSVKPKTQFLPKVNRTNAEASLKTTSSIGTPTGFLSNSFDAFLCRALESVSKASTSGMQVKGKSSTPVVDKINRIEKQLTGGKCVLVGDDGHEITENLHDIADILNIKVRVISCTKAQEYMAKGCQIFMAQISAKKEEGKSKGKQLKDVLIVQDFPKVFPKDLPGLPPARPVEFQIDLISGAAPVARAPYRLAPSEMKDLLEQLLELSEKGFSARARYSKDGIPNSVWSLGVPSYAIWANEQTTRVEYDWEPPRCGTCLVLGHSGDDCLEAHKRVVNRVEKDKGGSSGADDEGFIEVKKKKSGGNGGTKNFKPVSVKPKTQFVPKVNRTNAKASLKTASSIGKKNVSV
nr:Myc-type, basic helix-loop-helix (bHLH) domain-containing protein [Tanacetum cinerariifolium]